VNRNHLEFWEDPVQQAQVRKVHLRDRLVTKQREVSLDQKWIPISNKHLLNKGYHKEQIAIPLWYPGKDRIQVLNRFLNLRHRLQQCLFPQLLGLLLQLLLFHNLPRQHLKLLQLNQLRYLIKHLKLLLFKHNSKFHKAKPDNNNSNKVQQHKYQD
jgi:hypothetical protein